MTVADNGSPATTRTAVHASYVAAAVAVVALGVPLAILIHPLIGVSVGLFAGLLSMWAAAGVAHWWLSEGGV